MQLAGLGLLVWAGRQALRRGVSATTWLGVGFLVAWSALVYRRYCVSCRSLTQAIRAGLMFPAVTALSILLVVGLAGSSHVAWLPCR